ncbi:hypothetical protein COURTHOUSE_163 [Mycobacterium phage Courthouse]|uniref:dATP/dGTP diphosphohydrolase N-terminal domain-containing protein n=2 Tax=Omegavirus courthouse TaxID=1089119 RepID=G8I5M0_9CAUD|nr:hypothetical protein CM09_gp163 [Mycobacterium phage Courthouse]YP_009205296.1 DUF5664 domain-containing protein [Mycobacterium phage Ariel]ASZ74237.1 hypothetical protein SEA_SQUINT_161 [Mycobacterium phage Squint]ATS93005.1 hypothetical protein SEA_SUPERPHIKIMAN_164 [Mycobacterium phage Superphikiman]AER48014.1 hypothetical protein COURTHOUSE_163 [Mycobacterium phage Courthouse]AIM50043.1 hypothetical protein PBI_ARIEL_166 [Mycobacterium phage Ariel]
MSRGEVIHESSTGAKKAGNLERFDLLPAYPLQALARFYDGRTLSKGTLDRLGHYLWQFWDGVDDIDGIHPLVHAAHEVIELILAEGGDTWRAPEGATGFARIAPEAIRLLAEHYGRGARKYADHNWRLAYKWGLSFAALNRHLNQHRAGEVIDEETGSLHLVAVLWHIFTLLTFTNERPEFDDRWSTISKPT